MAKAFRIGCCNSIITIREFIASCEGSPSGYIHMNCPECAARHTLTVRNEMVRFGELDGFPGPSHIVQFTQRIPGLEYESDGDKRVLRYGDLSKSM